jgi:hypothetical protein
VEIWHSEPLVVDEETVKRFRTEIKARLRQASGVRVVFVVEEHERLVAHPLHAAPSEQAALDYIERILRETGGVSRRIALISENEMNRSLWATSTFPVDTLSAKASYEGWFDSFCAIVVRNRDAQAMVAEIKAARDRELRKYADSRRDRLWVHVCFAWAICWHLGVFKALSSVLNLIERVFARRA